MPAKFHVVLLATGALVHAAPFNPVDTTVLLQSKDHHANSKPMHLEKRRPQATQSSTSCYNALLEVDVRKEAAGAIGQMPVATKILVYSNYKQRAFGVHPGLPGTNARIDGSLANQNIGFTLAVGVWHKMYITLGCNGVHTFNVTDGIDPNKTWATTFNLANYYKGDLKAIAVSVNHPSPKRSIARPKLGHGQTECYTNDGTHCFKLVTPPSASTEECPISKQSTKRGDHATCCGWGDVHFQSLPTVFRSVDYPAGKTFDWQGIGPYDFATCAEKGIKVQVFQCPARRKGISWAVASACRAGTHTITTIGHDCYIDGVLVTQQTTTLTDGVVVEKDPEYVTIKGPNPPDNGIVKIKLTTAAGQNPMDIAQNVYMELPAGTDFAQVTGLCEDPNTDIQPEPTETLFSFNETQYLENQCFNLTNFSKDFWDPELPIGPEDLCAECNPPISYDDAKAMCNTTCPSFSEACALDVCGSCGATEVVTMTLDACSEETGPISTTTTTTTKGSPHAIGDPHARNARGESFDIRAWGALTMARIPRAETLASAGFSVVALVAPSTAKRCGPTYVTRVDVQGTWLGAPPVTLRVGHQGVPQVDEIENFTSVGTGRTFRKIQGNTTISETIGKKAVHVVVKVGRYEVDVKQLAEGDFKYLNLAIRGISGTVDEVGGLLGSDDHANATQVPPECRRPQDAIALSRNAGVSEGPYLQSTVTAE